MSDFSPASLPDLTYTFIDENYLQLAELIGSGESAKVYKAFDTTSSADDPYYYAVKCLRFAERDSSQGRILEAELTNHYKLRYDSGVVRLHRMFREGDFIFLVLDWCPGGDLFDAIFNEFIFEDRPYLVRETFVDTLDAVAQCHSRGVYHGDIRPANILLSARGKGVKLADFGASTREEVVRGDCPYSPRDWDLWSCAVILFNLITTEPYPWSVAHVTDPEYAAFRANPDTYFQDKFHLTPAANDLLRWCFAENPTTRPNLAQMRAAVLNIERFTLKWMLPRSVAVLELAADPSEEAQGLSTEASLASSSPSSSGSYSATLPPPPPPAQSVIIAPPAQLNQSVQAAAAAPPPNSGPPTTILRAPESRVRLYHLKRKDTVLREKMFKGMRRVRGYHH